MLPFSSQNQKHINDNEAYNRHGGAPPQNRVSHEVDLGIILFEHKLVESLEVLSQTSLSK